MLVVLPKTGWVDEFGAGSDRTTNNEMELTALVEALNYIRIKNIKMKTLILADSSYVLNGVQSWVAGWQRRGWKTASGGDVANLELWKQIYELRQGLQVSYQHVKGHAGIPGNERVDAIATAYADNNDPRLYSGSFASYGIQNILDLGISDQSVPVSAKKSSSQSSRTWYISLVGGVIQRHASWAECQARVHGVSAKFKKVSSQLEEASIIKSWKM